MFNQQLVNGLMLGSVYAMIGIGYTLVFGVLRMLNLAHAYFFMLGPFLAYALMGLGVPAAAALALALVGTGACGVLLYAVAFRPIPSSRPLAGFVTSLSFGIIIQVVLVNIYGTLPHAFTTGWTLPDFELGELILSGVQLASLAVALVLMAGLLFVIRRTPFGRNVRAVAENDRAAALLGVKVNRSVVLVFLISSMLAGLAGLMVGLRFESIESYMGDHLALKALAVIVIGGLGDVRGAMIVGLLLGVIEVLFQAYAPAGWSEAFAWIAMIGVLAFMPTGLFGSRIQRREI